MDERWTGSPTQNVETREVDLLRHQGLSTPTL